MSLVADYLRELSRAAVDGWNRFWFTPRDVATLGAVAHLRRRDAALHAPRLVARTRCVPRPRRLRSRRVGRGVLRRRRFVGPLRAELLVVREVVGRALDRAHRGPRRAGDVHARPLHARHVDPHVRHHAVVRQSRPRRALRPRPDQRHAGDVPDARPVRRGVLARSADRARAGQGGRLPPAAPTVDGQRRHAVDSTAHVHHLFLRRPRQTARRHVVARRRTLGRRHESRISNRRHHLARSTIRCSRRSSRKGPPTGNFRSAFSSGPGSCGRSRCSSRCRCTWASASAWA